MNNADEIRKQIQEAKDGIIDAVCCVKDSNNGFQYLVSTGLLERLVNDLIDLERQLIKSDTVNVKKALIRDIPTESLYYLQVKRGYEREFLDHNFIFGFVPVGESND